MAPRILVSPDRLRSILDDDLGVGAVQDGGACGVDGAQYAYRHAMAQRHACGGRQGERSGLASTNWKVPETVLTLLTRPTTA